MGIYISGLSLPTKDTNPITLMIFHDGSVWHFDDETEFRAIEVPPHGRLVWIPVTERLPGKFEDVLVCTEDYGQSYLGFVMVARWDGKDFVESWTNETALIGVSHWMPLPDPPNGGTDNG